MEAEAAVETDWNGHSHPEAEKSLEEAVHVGEAEGMVMVLVVGSTDRTDYPQVNAHMVMASLLLQLDLVELPVRWDRYA